MSEKSTFEAMRADERQARRRLIIEAAINLFGQKPFNEIGMRDIASQAGVSAASIYRYFPGRDDLLVEALIHEINKIVHEFEERLTRENVSIEVFSEYVIDYLIDNEATFQMMSYLMVKGQMSPGALEKFNRVQRKFLDGFDNVLKHAGILDNLRLFSQAFFASLAGVAMTYRNYPGRSKEEIRKHMQRLGLIIAQLFKRGLPDG